MSTLLTYLPLVLNIYIPIRSVKCLGKQKNQIFRRTTCFNPPTMLKHSGCNAISWIKGFLHSLSFLGNVMNMGGQFLYQVCYCVNEGVKNK